jgi:protein O-GlcNAc transferase
MNNGNDHFERAKHHFFLGLEHIRTSHYREAEIELRKSLEYVPDRLSTLVNLSAALLQLKRYAEAEAYIVQVRAQDPDSPEGLLNEGYLHRVRHEHAKALACFDQALEARKDYAEAHNSRGVTLADLDQLDAAIASFDKAIAINPDYAEAHCNRGDALRELNQPDAAIVSYAKAIDIRPDYDYLAGTLLHTRLQICDWQDYSASVAALTARIEANKKASLGFYVLSLTSSAEFQARCAQTFVSHRYPGNNSLGTIPGPSVPRPRIRLGYYSADYHNHATSYLMAGLFENHDKSRFETFAFSFGPRRADAMRKHVADAFDKFIDMRDMSDQQVARQSRDLGIDVAVDLKGFTQGSRTGIFAHRAAPIQVSYPGYPGTMAADYIDYLIADRIVVPETNLSHYSEKLAYLPHCYQVNDRQRSVADRVSTRAELGLPDAAFVYCCLNNSYKITPDIFDLWARILQRVEGSVLWLLEDNATAVRNLRQEAQRRNLDPERLVFAGRLPIAEHLARHRAADLFLDTLPYNAHTTASDALWVGLPVLTLQGSAFHGRVASSLLAAVGLPELVTTTVEAYETMAIRLAQEPELLRSFRTRPAQNRLTTPLFDTPLFTRHIEEAYARMYERYCKGLAPDTFLVDGAVR